MALTDTARRLLADLPPFEQDSPTIQRVVDTMARELDRVDAAVTAVKAEVVPSTSAVVLRAWEALFKLPIAPVNKTLAQRRAAVVAYLTALGSSGSGEDWEASMTALLGSGWSYTEYAPEADRDAAGNLVSDPRFTNIAHWTASVNANDQHDDFAVDDLAANYDVLLGAGTLSITGGQLHPTSTAPKLLRRKGFRYYSAVATTEVKFGSTVANDEGCAALKIQDNGDCLFAAYESGNLRIYSRIAGVNTLIVGVAVSVPAANALRWIQFFVTDDAKVVASWYSSDPLSNSSDADTVLTPLAGAALTAFGPSVAGGAGIYWPSTHASLTAAVEDFRIQDEGRELHAIDVSGQGLVSTNPGFSPDYWQMFVDYPAALADGPATEGRYFAARLRMTIIEVVDSASPPSLEVFYRDGSGTPFGNAVLPNDGVPMSDYAPGDVLELAGVGQFPIPAGVEHIGLRMFIQGPVTGGKLLFERGLVMQVVSPDSAVVPYFDGETDGYEWSGTPDDSVSRSTSPDPYVLNFRLPYAPPIAVPAQPSGTPSGGGGPTVYYSVTALNFYGETTPSPDRSTNLPPGGHITLDWPDITGADGYAIYRGSSAGTKQLIATTTASTYIDNGDAPISVATPPVTNTTSSPQLDDAKRLARAITPANLDLEFVYAAGFIMGVSRFGEVL